LKNPGRGRTRSVSLRSDSRRFSPDFSALAHRVQGGDKDKMLGITGGPSRPVDAVVMP